MAGLGGPVHGDQPEGHGEALLPFKIIQQAPVAVALHGNAVGDAVPHPLQGLADEFCPPGIIGSGDAVFRDDQHSFEIFRHCPDHIFQALGIELVIHLGQLRAFGAVQLAEGADPGPGIVLNAQIVIVFDIGQIVAEFLLPEGQVLTEEEKEALYRQRRSAKAMIRLIDDQIGKILELLELRDMLKDTLILFTSDHGDMLGDHYLIQKGVPWRQALNVPLAAWLPGARPVGKRTGVVELHDIAATILDYAGLDPEEALSRSWPAYNDRLPCRSFLPVLRGETERHRKFAYSESDFTEERHGDTVFSEVLRKRGGGGKRSSAWRSVVTEEYKYIRYLGYELGEAPYEEFYDLTLDPMETHNRIEDPAYAEQLREARLTMDYVTDHYPAAQLTWATACAAERRLS